MGAKATAACAQHPHQHQQLGKMYGDGQAHHEAGKREIGDHQLHDRRRQ
jgi:hypothetical protein